MPTFVINSVIFEDMDERLIGILIENIQFQLRHEAYDRTLDVRDFAHSMTTGDGQEEEVTRYRRFEDDALKAQRVRLYNPRTKYALARPRKYWKRVGRVEGIRRKFTAPDETAVQELTDMFYNFMPGQDLETWLNEKLESFGMTDPNKWIVYERADRRNEEGKIIETRVYPFIIDSVNALNWQEEYAVLQWFVCRTVEMERVIKSGTVMSRVLENYFLYAPGWVIRAREVGEKTVQEPGEYLQTIEVFAPQDAHIAHGEGMVNPLPTASSRIRSFYIRARMNGTTEVPAEVCGCYPDEKTGMKCWVPWFDPAEHVLQDLVKNKSSLDVVQTVHTYPRRTEYTPPCTDSHPELGQCIGGWYNDVHDDDHRCHACGGSGKRPNFTTEQEVIQLVLPDNREGLLELSKLAFTEPVDTAFPEFLDSQCEKDEARIMAAVFDTGLYQKPNDSKARTATEIDAVMQGITDVLSRFAGLISRHVEKAYRIAAQYREVQGFEADHSFPDDFDIANLAELLESFKQIKESGVGYEAIATQRARVFQKLFEGSPAIQKKVAARYAWLPFDDKSPEEAVMILASRSPLDDMRVLRENWLEIFKEIEEENPDFPDMTHKKQRAVVMAKVADFKTRIVLIDAEPQPDFAPALPDDTPEDMPDDNEQPDANE